jgi:septal ring factor EnvC (AmiA/AmiB activator)
MAETVPPNRPHIKVALIAAILVFAVVAVMWQNSKARTLASQNQQMASTLQQTQAELDAMKTKLDSLTPPPAPVVVPAEAPAKPAAAVHHSAAHATHVTHHQADDPRWKQFQSRLDEQGKAIDANRQDLSSTRTELTGSIARTHDELVALERKGERSYFEFDINKNKEFKRSGPVGIRLRKANTKHSYADLELQVDDADLSKKHVNLYEPVTFYASQDGRPVELVINSVTKDHIHGYVATPKYSATDLAAMTNSNPDGTAAPARQKLELPKN